ncbi:short-chain dehydrogenase/reductase [Nocardia sp. AB354]|uniref:short-chain dehydrogenase/reductase n=1 Tax=Nocardia sp. AB354 TaxID=3413283 RepID=UPI003C2A3779
MNPLSLLSQPVPIWRRGCGRIDPKGRVAFVTGAAQGIGLATAEALVARGVRVVLVDVDTDRLEQAMAALGAQVAHGVTADVRDRDAMAEAAAEAVRRFGRIDVVVANAGITPPPATLRDTDLDDFDRVIAINLTGVVNTVKPALEQVIEHQGHIVMVASVAAFAPVFGGASYVASKAGVEQLGRALRIELGSTGATAGVAYFGSVDTALVKHAFDDDPLGHRVDMLMPAPVRRRITPSRAAEVLVDGIVNRSARTIAPLAWEPYSLFRELVNRPLVSLFRVDPRVQDIVRALEQRNRATR